MKLTLLRVQEPVNVETVPDCAGHGCGNHSACTADISTVPDHRNMYSGGCKDIVRDGRSVKLRSDEATAGFKGFLPFGFGNDGDRDG